MTIGTEPIVGRLAPSPTGGLHIGHARTFLIAWLAARSAKGRIVLRIEDIDASRVKPDATVNAILDLNWLWLNWDEGPDIEGPNSPYLQSQRRKRYEASLTVLMEKELVYPCTCSRADIARAASAPHAEDEGPTYPGTCSGRSSKDAERMDGRPYCWRFRVEAGWVDWLDLIRGQVTSNPAKLGGDFIVGRSSGEPAYQLAVVCDDHEMGINQVLRGDDLIPSTPRQILLFRALGWTEPRFGHLPLVLGEDGRRLAKRDGSIKLTTLRESGVDASRLLDLLANSIGLKAVSGRADLDKWIESFSLANVPHEPWVFHTAAIH